MNWFAPTALLFTVAGLTARSQFNRDRRAIDRDWRRLIATSVKDPQPFDPASIADQPEPARRMLSALIQPGTPLCTVAEISMHGELSLDTREKKDYWPMQASQILAAPHGFVWQVSTGKPWFRLYGSDGQVQDDSWTRFWLNGALPLVNAGRSRDHLRSSFGRCIAEAAFWTPAALMPSESVQWTARDADTARVTVRHGDLSQVIDLTLDDAGHPQRIVFDRWSDANAGKTWRLQPFGATLSDFRQFGGFTVPTRVEAGNHFGTENYFPFFKAIVDDVRYIDSPDAERGLPAP